MTSLFYWHGNRASAYLSTLAPITPLLSGRAGIGVQVSHTPKDPPVTTTHVGSHSSPISSIGPIIRPWNKVWFGKLEALQGEGWQLAHYFTEDGEERQGIDMKHTQISVAFSWCQTNAEGTTSKRTQCFSSFSHLPWAHACDNWEAQSGFSGIGTNAVKSVLQQ